MRIKKLNHSIKQASFLMALLTVSLVSQAAQETPKGPPPSPVQVEQVRVLEEMPTASIMGTVYSKNQVQLTAGVNGRLEWVAEPGSYLRKGDLVAQIELLPLQLRQAERKAQFKRAKINLVYLTKELKRQSELRIKNNTSQLQLEQTQSQVELAKSDIEIAELQLKQVNQELTRATIKSPFEGVVTQRFLRAGFDVGRSDVLVDLLDTKQLEVRVAIPIKFLAYTKPGTLVTLSSKNSDNKPLLLEASATTIIPAANPLSQTFEMRVEVPKAGSEFWSTGQLVNVEIPVQSKRMTLAVHRDALILRSDGTYVVKIDDKNIAHRLKVRVGKGKDNWVQVSGEISSGDRVAIRGAERLTEGQTVSIQSAGK